MIRKKEIQMKFPCRVLFVLLGLLSSDVSAQKILYTQDEHLGIRVPDVSLNRWQSREMEPDLQPSPADYQDLKEDFFLLEYGVPLTFKTDLLKEFGARVKGAYQIRNGALEFQVPKKGWSMLFGAKYAKDFDLSRVRFPERDARCPNSTPTDRPLYILKTGKVAPRVIPIDAMSWPLNL